MKKLKFIIAIVLVGALVSTKAPSTYAAEGLSEEKDFTFMIYGEESNESVTVNILNDTYYKVVVPSFIELNQLQNISYNYFYDDIQVTGDEGVDFGADNTPFEINSTTGFLSSYGARFWSLEGSDLVERGRLETWDAWMSNSEIIKVKVLSYYQEEKALYFLGENDTSSELNNFYVLKDAVKYQPTSSINYQDNYNLISLQFDFTTGTYGDTEYYEGFNQGYVQGRDEGLSEGVLIGENNYTPSGEWGFDEDNMLYVLTENNTRFDIGDRPYNIAYNDGFNDGFAEQADGTYFGFDWIIGFFGMFGAIFSIELLPGLSIGLIVGVPIAFSLTLGIIKVIRG